MSRSERPREPSHGLARDRLGHLMQARRRDLVRTRTRTIIQLHQLLMEPNPSRAREQLTAKKAKALRSPRRSSARQRSPLGSRPVQTVGVSNPTPDLPCGPHAHVGRRSSRCTLDADSSRSGGNPSATVVSAFRNLLSPGLAWDLTFSARWPGMGRPTRGRADVQYDEGCSHAPGSLGSRQTSPWSD